MARNVYTHYIFIIYVYREMCICINSFHVCMCIYIHIDMCVYREMCMYINNIHICICLYKHQQVGWILQVRGAHLPQAILPIEP